MTDDRVAELAERVDELAAELERRGERIDALEDRLDAKDDEIEELQETVEEQEKRLDELEGWKRSASRKLKRLGEATSELQTRELEKGAHLEADNVIPALLRTSTEHVEKFTKEDGARYVRIPGSEDPVDDDPVAMALDDLLPIQQLARLPEDVLDEQLGNKENLRRAVWLWENREELMHSGCGGVDLYVDAGELAQDLSIKFDVEPTSETAKRVMRYFCEFASDRAYTKVQQKSGYEERRLIIPSDASIPGKAGSGSYNGVVSD